jgi:hypothetical protein
MASIGQATALSRSLQQGDSESRTRYSVLTLEERGRPAQRDPALPSYKLVFRPPGVGGSSVFGWGLERIAFTATAAKRNENRVQGSPVGQEVIRLRERRQANHQSHQRFFRAIRIRVCGVWALTTAAPNV